MHLSIPFAEHFLIVQHNRIENIEKKQTNSRNKTGTTEDDYGHV